MCSMPRACGERRSRRHGLHFVGLWRLGGKPFREGSTAAPILSLWRLKSGGEAMAETYAHLYENVNHRPPVFQRVWTAAATGQRGIPVRCRGASQRSDPVARRRLRATEVTYIADTRCRYPRGARFTAHGYRVFNLGNEQPVVIRDLIHVVEVVGKAATIEYHPRSPPIHRSPSRTIAGRAPNSATNPKCISKPVSLASMSGTAPRKPPVIDPAAKTTAVRLRLNGAVDDISLDAVLTDPAPDVIDPAHSTHGDIGKAVAEVSRSGGGCGGPNDPLVLISAAIIVLVVFRLNINRRGLAQRPQRRSVAARARLRGLLSRSRCARCAGSSSLQNCGLRPRCTASKPQPSMG